MPLHQKLTSGLTLEDSSDRFLYFMKKCKSLCSSKCKLDSPWQCLGEQIDFHTSPSQKLIY
ncbi:hypothetical protein Lalb_Chr11g0071691 [Lupinus albus]|uniref:Uncharacterized protein n=1 Tax=Lupinus albus TaxID=3870 RepID=A0A6A4PT36_LUPAL|nr:hypothetical protein Lalb_Chr11g0071691 [Lupinus albus]